MGVGIWPSSRGSYSSFDGSRNRNPNPLKYKILTATQIDIYLIVKIKYLACTNFEGVKILVYKDCTLKQLIKQKVIDPHFSENTNKKSPIARFIPTEDGMKMAITFVETLSKKE